MIRLPKILRALAVAAIIAAGAASGTRGDEGPRVIKISAKRFEFTPSQLNLKKDEAVKLLVTSEDVTHGFFSRPLHIDADLKPGQTVEVEVTPTAAGAFTIICDHFCGAQHGNMKLAVIVE